MLILEIHDRALTDRMLFPDISKSVTALKVTYPDIYLVVGLKRHTATI